MPYLPEHSGEKKRGDNSTLVSSVQMNFHVLRDSAVTPTSISGAAVEEEEEDQFTEVSACERGSVVARISPLLLMTKRYL